MKNILVTGGAGFIGSNFIHYMLEADKDVRIINIDKLTYAGDTANLMGLPGPERHVFRQKCIYENRKEIEIYLKHYYIDTIVHFAAETHVDNSIDSSEEFIKTNVLGTHNLLEAARRYWNEGENPIHFHHISTDEVYGTLGSYEDPWDESCPYKPSSPYSASKASSDHLVRAYGHTYGLPYTITNCSNNYGERQHPEKLIPKIITNAIKGKTIPIYGDGMQRRDWLYVQDHCEAIKLVIEKGTVGETYNVGGSNNPANLSIALEICGIVNDMAGYNKSGEKLIKYVKDRPGHDRRYQVNTEKIESELGWMPAISLYYGLEKTVKWYLERSE